MVVYSQDSIKHGCFSSQVLWIEPRALLMLPLRNILNPSLFLQIYEFRFQNSGSCVDVLGVSDFTLHLVFLFLQQNIILLNCVVRSKKARPLRILYFISFYFRSDGKVFVSSCYGCKRFRITAAKNSSGCFHA